MRFQCPECRGIVAVDNFDTGRQVECGHCRKRVTVPESRVSPGAVLADFVIQKELGRGGMGIVYLSHQISLDRPSALKVLAENYAKNTEFVVGFIKEARAAAKLNHPNIVQAYAVGEDEEVYYFAMEYVEGRTMKQVLDREKVIPVDKAVLIIEQIADALDYAWKEERLIHRDIKPDNIMLTNNGRAKLADLGLAKKADDKDDLGSEDEVMGTPQYISPEHLTGAPMDVRSDIYSLGATFYHFVTGRFPFTGSNAVEIAKKHLNSPLESPIKINPKIPPDVAAIIEKMMAKNPNDRYQDAEKLVDDLRSLRKKKRTIQLNFSKLGSATQTGPISFSATQTGAIGTATSPLSQGGVPTTPFTPNLPTGSVPFNPAATTTSIQTNPVLGTAAPTTPFVPNPGKTAVPGGGTAPSLTQSLPGVTNTQTGLNAVIEKRESSSKLKFVALIFGILLFLSVLGGGIWYFVFWKPSGVELAPSSEKTSRTAQKEVAPAPEVLPEPASTPYTVKCKEILNYISAHPFEAKSIIQRCEDFLLNTPKVPQYKIEQSLRHQLLEGYAAAEEQLLMTPRTDAHDARRREILEQDRLADIRRKEEQERRAREAELKRLEDEKRRKEQARLAAERRELDELRRTLKNVRNSLRLPVYRLCAEGKFSEAKALLDRVLQTPGTLNGKPQDIRNLGWQNANWAKMIQSWIVSAEKLHAILEDSGDRIKGTQVVYNNNFGTIDSIRNGMATGKVNGREAHFNLKELTGNEFEALMRRIARSTKNDNEALLYYFLLTGHIKGALPSTILLSRQDQKQEFSAFVREILKDQYNKATPAQRNLMKREFGNPPGFDRAASLK